MTSKRWFWSIINLGDKFKDEVKVLKWKAALEKVANMSGFELRGTSDELCVCARARVCFIYEVKEEFMGKFYTNPGSAEYLYSNQSKSQFSKHKSRPTHKLKYGNRLNSSDALLQEY